MPLRPANRFDRLRPRLRGPLLLLGVGAGYLTLAQFVVWLNDPVRLGAGFWPAAGFSLGVLVLVHPRRWGWVLLGVGLAELGGDLARDYPLDASLWWAAGNCVEPLIGALLLRRWGNPSGALVPLRQFGRFVAAAVVAGPLVGASIGTIGSVFALGPMSVWEVWPKYVSGDALGVLVVAPMLLCWRERRIVRHPAETATLVVGLLGVTYVAFNSGVGPLDMAPPFLVIPLLTWAAVRHGCRGTTVALFTIAQFANWSTATGSGPFVHAGTGSGQAVTLLQMFLGLTAVSAFVLAALVEELVDRTEVEARLEELAVTDALTGLPNRMVLASSLAVGLASPTNPRDGVAVFACDLDHFKVVNDGLGHQAGDEVLVEVARRMRRCVRPGDLVTRLGGDEFVVVMNAPGVDLKTLAQRVIAAVAEPMTLTDGTTLSPSVSIGIAHCGPGTDPTSLLRDADAALYHAKELGRGRSHQFDDALRLRVLDRLLVQTELNEALTNGDLRCVYQPEIVIESGELFGLEALSRWHHPTRGLITPDRFIPAIEAMGAAGRLFDHVLDEALGAQAQWAKRLGFHPPIAVNLSACQLGDRDLPGAVARALSRAGAPAGSLWLEVTESALAGETAVSGLLAVHDLGVHLAIDDFGTGWSSMARLAAFPWDLLKIDRSFVAALGGGSGSGHAEQVVKSTIAMAHALGIRTTAEGVETFQQLDCLAEMGCDIAQGYLFARPAAARDAVEHVTVDGRWTGPGNRGPVDFRAA